MALSTYSSFLIVNRDMNKSLNQVASESVVKRETQYYQDNIGKATTVEEFMSDYRLFSYAMKAYGLEDMTYAKAFMKKVLESDLTDSSSFANSLSDTRYRQFAAAYNFAGSTEMAQSSAQESDVTDAYKGLATDEATAVSAETAYYDKYIDKVTTVDQFAKNTRLATYALKAHGLYVENYSTSKLSALLSSDLTDTSSYAYVNYVQPKADYQSQNDGLQLGIDMVDERSTLKTQNDSIQAQLDAGGLDSATQASLEQQKTDNETRISEIETELGSSDDTELANLSYTYSTMIKSNDAKIANIDKWLDFKAQFSFNPDGSLVNSTAQTADQKSAMEEKYLVKMSTKPSYALYLSNQQHYEDVVANATSVDDLMNDSRVVDYIKTTYGISVQYDSSLRSILTSDPDNSSSFAAIMGYTDVTRLFNFNTDGSVKSGMQAQSNEEITYTNSKGNSVTVNPVQAAAALYKENFLYSYDDEVDLTVSNYEKRIDAVTSVDDLFVTNATYWAENATTSSDYTDHKDLPELWEVALSSYGLDPNSYSETKIKRILTSNLDDKNSYIYTLKDDRLVEFAKAFNFDDKGKIDTPLQAQNELVVNDLAKAYTSQKTRFLTGTPLETATKAAATELTYYKEQIARIKTADELLSDSRLVNVMLTAHGIDPKSVTTKELKNMFLSDLSDTKSYVNTQTNKEFAELVASFNFDSKGNLTDASDVIGNVQQRGDVLETVNRYVQQTLEEEKGNENEGVRVALYFQRLAPDITSAYTILGDSALVQFLTTAFSLSSYFSNMDVDKQKAMVDKLVDVEKLSDPDYVQTLVQRYTAMYDSANNTASSPALSIMQGSSTISASTLLAVAQLSSR